MLNTGSMISFLCDARVLAKTYNHVPRPRNAEFVAEGRGEFDGTFTTPWTKRRDRRATSCSELTGCLEGLAILDVSWFRAAKSEESLPWVVLGLRVCAVVQHGGRRRELGGDSDELRASDGHVARFSINL